MNFKGKAGKKNYKKNSQMQQFCILAVTKPKQQFLFIHSQRFNNATIDCADID